MNKKNFFEFIKILISLAMSIVVSLLVGELIVRLISDHSLIYDIEMLKYAKQLKIRDPQNIVSHIHKPNSSANLMGVDIRLNSLGQRAREPEEKKADKERILVVGSSVTMGWGVNYEQIFTTISESFWNGEHPQNKIEIFNSGIGNYSSCYQLELFKRQFSIIYPDITILNFFISDVEPRLIKNESFVLRNIYLANILYGFVNKLLFSSQYKNLFNYYNYLYEKKSGYWPNSLSCILEIKKIAESGGGKFAILMTPELHDLSVNTPYREIYKKINEDFKSRGIYVEDSFDSLSRKFGGNEKALWVQIEDPHPNYLGHEVMSEALLKMIQNLIKK